MKIIVKNEISTKLLAEKIAPFLHPNLFLLLEGPLAAGKTTFTKYLLKALGVTVPVTSPTFLIMQQYTTNQQIIVNHMDCYRLLGLEQEEEWEMYFEHFPDSINIIEWPAGISNQLSSKYEVIKITIKIINEHERIFTIKTTNKHLQIALGKEG
ncbi:tRNA (adenosine(37)-N6)-threonylcarbamoyltransferase complex ATPase subunit type 1 TsaE [Spiroplasma sp. ChiS]|uniref:tRNA (adenosine(37)-N6)-threonylcarbamoyltransferase complex ATPase subunit type 1 TsaE n=1 Tax=Spiroplasma sp. ChiS TaxID=2099885 RepID=UPI000CF8CA5E|nr:tRNA (adenosine(37)-N6)-threonylcarbamoyltransferase complex ATPase subunit type 1 TsaE [Spiroplasma sp. ChiS]PQP78739.1 tRNA (adenosine(37)-N6)-threonylcarbamoyltransferase complex ATPase subunit type 1 TsaE [Spiroplasma sp. ChiS]